ncbi:MAG TPA: SAM-dependent methyltransferase [Polyangiaceae bacterium]
MRAELSAAFPAGTRELEPGLFACEPRPETRAELPHLVFGRQVLPDAREVGASSISLWAGVVVDAVLGVLPDREPWSLHVHPFEAVSESSRMGARAWHSRARERPAPPIRPPRDPRGAGPTRCRLIREAVVELLEKRRRHLLRSLRSDSAPFLDNEALVQLVLTSAEQGFLSLAPAPLPFRQRHAVSAFSGGEVPRAVDKQAPSRAFAKLVEAEARMGRRIAARDSCVDLGASPGSWTYVCVQRGALVTAVDRSELRADLMRHPNVRFQRGDAFRFEPKQPVSWLVCDVIARAERSAELLSRWLQERWCRHFVVTLKIDDDEAGAVLSKLGRDLQSLTREFWLLRLSANKKEVCAFGARA